MPAKLMIECENLTKRFGNFTAVDHVTFSVARGSIFGFLGPNGSGKSTVIRMLCGILEPTEGTARVAGIDVVHQTELLKGTIGYMSQKFSLYDELTVTENLVFYSRLYGLRGAVSGDRLHKFAALLDANDRDSLYQKMTSLHLSPESLVIDGHEPCAAAMAALESPLHRMMYRDSIEYLPDDILVKVDRATMAVGLEARAPLLDQNVIELAWKMPVDMLTRDGKGKWPLRQIFNRLLPDAISDRAKQGFSVPISDWLRVPLREWAEDLLSEKKLIDGGILAPAPIRKMWAEHLSGRRNWGAQLWAVLMFCSWHERWCTAEPSLRQESIESVVA